MGAGCYLTLVAEPDETGSGPRLLPGSFVFIVLAFVSFLGTLTYDYASHYAVFSLALAVDDFGTRSGTGALPGLHRLRGLRASLWSSTSLAWSTLDELYVTCFEQPGRALRHLLRAPWTSSTSLAGTRFLEEHFVVEDVFV